MLISYILKTFIELLITNKIWNYLPYPFDVHEHTRE